MSNALAAQIRHAKSTNLGRMIKLSMTHHQKFSRTTDFAAVLPQLLRLPPQLAGNFPAEVSAAGAHAAVGLGCWLLTDGCK
jgi:hypothetical protein